MVAAMAPFPLDLQADQAKGLINSLLQEPDNSRRYRQATDTALNILTACMLPFEQCAQTISISAHACHDFREPGINNALPSCTAACRIQASPEPFMHVADLMCVATMQFTIVYSVSSLDTLCMLTRQACRHRRQTHNY